MCAAFSEFSKIYSGRKNLYAMYDPKVFSPTGHYITDEGKKILDGAMEVSMSELKEMEKKVRDETFKKQESWFNLERAMDMALGIGAFC